MIACRRARPSDRVRSVSEIVVFSGSAHRPLAERICSELGQPLSAADTVRFSNDCLQIQLLANCRRKDVYIIQPLVPPTQDHLMELLLMIDGITFVGKLYYYQ